MKLEPGSQLAHYEIIELIGKGGMGEIYRARDTRLPREVAIKTSSEKFSERFAREAKVIASLNHPNICTLYDVGPDYLVMELVEGPTLADRIREGPLDLDEATAIAQQVADALDYAHERGVVHRDLKPGNIKIRPDGVVRVLDHTAWQERAIEMKQKLQDLYQDHENKLNELKTTEANLIKTHQDSLSEWLKRLEAATMQAEKG